MGGLVDRDSNAAAWIVHNPGVHFESASFAQTAQRGNGGAGAV